MVLRLSSSNSNATVTSTTTAATTCGNETLDRLRQDTTLTESQKIDCLKTLSVIVKNVLDPVKSQDVKYRSLKCDNDKLQERLLRINYIQEDLLKKTMGFVLTTTTKTNQLVVDVIDVPIYQQVQSAVTLALKQLQGTLAVGGDRDDEPLSSSTSTMVVLKKARIELTESESTKLSEKQKARRLLQERQEREKLEAKEERKRNLDLLKQDKLIRETDPNWKPGLSAACAKSGSSISTFRDKYGEH